MLNAEHNEAIKSVDIKQEKIRADFDELLGTKFQATPTITATVRKTFFNGMNKFNFSQENNGIYRAKRRYTC